MKDVTKCLACGLKCPSWSALALHTIDEHKQIAMDFLTAYFLGMDMGGAIA